MFDEYAERIRREAIAAYPSEAVWLVTQDGVCKKVKNCADNPTETFRVNKKTMASAQSKGLAAVIHSHPDYPACPSAADMRSQLSSAVPWGVVATDGTNTTPVTWWGGDTSKAPLEGRVFIHGVQDCYELIRDWFELKRNIVLKQFPRDWNWWTDGGDLYQQGFGEAGFVRVDKNQAQPGDVWLAQFVRDAGVPHHGGILLERGECLHHLASRYPVDKSRLSKREPINRWLPYITHVLRYRP